MTTAAKTKSNKIPQRDDIADNHKWDLTDLYKNNEAWDDAFEKAESTIEKGATFAGKLAESAAILFDCLSLRTELLQICGNLYQYAKLNQDLDNRVSKYQAMTDRAAMLSSRAHAAFAFVEPELLTLENDKLRAMGKKFPDTNLYDFYIEELIRSRAHIRSTEVEEVLAQSAMIARGPDSIFTMLDDADLKYPLIEDEDGNQVQLTKARYSKFMESPDQRVRKDAHLAFNSVYKDHNNMLSASLSTEVNKNIFYANARKYDSTLHYALDGNNIPLTVYNSLLDTTEAGIAPMHKWMAVRKKILGVDKLYPYDNICPLFPDQNYEVGYDDAVKSILEAVKPLGVEYGKVLKKAFDSRWIDVYETEGKGSGAYNWGNFTTHPYILMNYNDTIDNMFTLAHEMGHAMHSFLSNKTQPYPKSQYSIFVAEVASTLNEGLLLNYLLSQTNDKKQKLFLLNRHLDNTFGTFFHQVFYARFELAIHEIVEKGEALSPDLMNQLWEELTKRYYGDAIEMDEMTQYKWSRIPHFYMTFYVFQYATSYAASQSMLDKFMAGEAGIVDKYLELLSSGGNDYPINQLKKCGVDMTTPDPVKATLKLFAKQVDEVERLTGES